MPIAWRSDRPARPALVEPCLDRIPDERLQSAPVEPVDLTNAGRRGHVDLGQIVADDVDADEEQALPAQRRTDRRTDLAFAPGQSALHRGAADMQIGARLALGRHPQYRADRLALDEDDALVAGPHLGAINLHDQRPAIEQGGHLEQRLEILVFRAGAEAGGASIAEQGLDDDVTVLGAE